MPPGAMISRDMRHLSMWTVRRGIARRGALGGLDAAGRGVRPSWPRLPGKPRHQVAHATVPPRGAKGCSGSWGVGLVARIIRSSDGSCTHSSIETWVWDPMATRYPGGYPKGSRDRDTQGGTLDQRSWGVAPGGQATPIPARRCARGRTTTSSHRCSSVPIIHFANGFGSMYRMVLWGSVVPGFLGCVGGVRRVVVPASTVPTHACRHACSLPWVHEDRGAGAGAYQ